MSRLPRLLLPAVITAAAAIAVVRLVAPADGTSAVRRQLAFLRASLESGAQRAFPEGYFFMKVLYSLG